MEAQTKIKTKKSCAKTRDMHGLTKQTKTNKDKKDLYICKGSCVTNNFIISSFTHSLN